MSTNNQNSEARPELVNEMFKKIESNIKEEGYIHKQSNSSDDTLVIKEEADANINGSRKKYNVINEDLRKIIIRKLTVENQNIKEVAKEHDLKLSTCKAILNVYLKEGRIGKKTQRDRKFKIVNTLICTTLNPLNPLQSSVTPYVSITETKTSKMKSPEKQSEMVKEAIKQACDHLQNVFNQNSGDIFGIKIPQNSQNQLQQAFMQAQMQSLNSMLIKNQNGQQQQNLQQQNTGFNNFNNLTQGLGMQLNQLTPNPLQQSPQNNQGFLQHFAANNNNSPNILQMPSAQKLSLDSISQFQLASENNKKVQDNQVSNLDLQGIENIQKKIIHREQR